MKKVILHTLAVLLLPLSALAQPHDATTLRLATIGKVWGAAKYAHPYLGYRDIDWDAAAVRAIERARGTDPLPVIVDDMLAAFADPVTGVRRVCVAFPTVIPDEPKYQRVEDAVLLPFSTLGDATIDEELRGVIASATHLILDLRPPEEVCGSSDLALIPEIERLVVRGTLPLPQHRKVKHRGYRSQDIDFDPLYWSDFLVEDFAEISGSEGGSGANVSFLVDERTALPPFAVAMVLAGKGRVIAAGDFDERSVVDTMEIAIDDSHIAVIRTSELVANGNGWTLAAAATVPASSSRESLVAAALATTPRARRRSVALPGKPLPGYAWKQDEAYADMHYPPYEYRVLAAFRLWNVIHYFYGYRHLIGDWEARLPQVIELLAAAASQRDYDLGLAKAMTWVPDGHSGVYSPSMLELRGTVSPPFLLMPVEGKPVVVEIIDSAAAGPVSPGDELLAVDGRPVSERRAELEPYISASTDAAREFYITVSLPRASAPSPAELTFRTPAGMEYTTTIERGSYTRTPPERAWSVLEGGIGYADLRWLEPQDVPQMFSDFQGTRGIIFDIRNYPLGVFAILASYLNTTGGPALTSQVRVPNVIGGETVWEEYPQNLGVSSAPKYTAPIVALIDERAQSQSEHTCLVLDAINSTTQFVGTATVGANGNISFMVMPGEIYIMFGGMDIRHLDGRQLQQVGVVPDVEVPRTIEALRTGRDEVLERAIEILSQ